MFMGTDHNEFKILCIKTIGQEIVKPMDCECMDKDTPKIAFLFSSNGGIVSYFSYRGIQLLLLRSGEFFYFSCKGP